MKNKKIVPSIRVGVGYDVHKLVRGRKLILGGVKIPFEQGLLGHSDADVLLHAICDALLGAAALGDIGKHFPDSEKRFKDIQSLKLLVMVKRLLKTKGYVVSNVDVSVILEQPKIGKYSAMMRKNIAKSLGISSNDVSVKATTHERLGSFGRGEGCAAIAIASIFREIGS